MPEEPKKSRVAVAALSLTSIALIVLHFVSVGGGIAIIYKYGWKFIPYHFVMMTIWTVVILTCGALIRRRWPALNERLTFDPKRLESPRWAWIQKKGAFLTVVLLTSFVGPVVATLFLQFINVGGRRAWVYGLSANVIATVAMFVFWKYLFVLIKPYLAHLTHLLH